MSPRPLLRLVCTLLVAALALVMGCSVNSRPRRRGDDAGPMPMPMGDAGPLMGCGPGRPECPIGLSCVDGICVTPAATCGPCPAPGECRGDRCIQPAAEGAICEFDEECGDAFLCIAGRCTPDPRVPVPCGALGECTGGLVCVGETCGCTFSADCPVGLECIAGRCDVPSGCVADIDCGGVLVCDAGVCVDRSTCDTVDPDLAGAWEMSSDLRLREALPTWLSSFLDAVEGPFRYLSGDGPCFSLGLPGFIESAVCALIAPTRDSLPTWVRGLLGAIADLNVVLSTWHVNESMQLDSTGVDGSYRGTHVWNRVRFVSRSTSLEVDPRTIFDWRFEPDPFDAVASCGVLNISRHEIDLSIGALIAWLVGAVIGEATDGRYTDLGSAARAATTGFCDALAAAASSSIDPAIAGAVRAGCTSEIGGAIDDAVRAIEMARVEVSPVTLRGSAPIEGPRSLRPGHWDGTLLGSDFTGDWQAWR